jgi:hypothetical protein
LRRLGDIEALKKEAEGPSRTCEEELALANRIFASF